MSQPDNHKNSLPDAQAALIGRITSEWALMEMKMSFLLQELLDVEPNIAGAVLFTVQSNKVRRDIIQNVTENTSLDDDLKKRIHRILKRIGKAATKRNAAIHSLWVHLEEFDSTIQFNINPQTIMTGHEVKKDEPLRLLNQIIAISNDLVRLAVDVSIVVRPPHNPVKPHDETIL